MTFTSFKMFGYVIAMLLATDGLIVSASARQCACASVDTMIYSDYTSENSTFGTLTAPNCLPYLEDQRAENNGRTYANVSYHKQPAWLLSTDIYLKKCTALFGCVCTTKRSDVFEDYATDSLPLTTLRRGQCTPLKGRTETCSEETWIPIDVGDQPGWIQSGNAVFHKACTESSDCPRIISRAEWGARSARSGVGRLGQTPQYAIIHHGASPACNTREDCVRIIQSYQNFHMDGRGWSDIGYNFMIGEDGNVYEGRGWDAVGAHTYGYNSKSLGFTVIGNFSDRAPNKFALRALNRIISCGVAVGKLSPTYSLFGRRDVGVYSESPGQKLYEVIQQWERYGLP